MWGVVLVVLSLYVVVRNASVDGPVEVRLSGCFFIGSQFNVVIILCVSELWRMTVEQTEGGKNCIHVHLHFPRLHRYCLVKQDST